VWLSKRRPTTKEGETTLLVLLAISTLNTVQWDGRPRRFRRNFTITFSDTLLARIDPRATSQKKSLAIGQKAAPKTVGEMEAADQVMMYMNQEGHKIAEIAEAYGQVEGCATPKEATVSARITRIKENLNPVMPHHICIPAGKIRFN
jgi:hypothetical protein